MKIEINLWELMGKNKMTALKLSSLTWISPIQISNIKNGKTSKIELQTIAKFLEAFDCTPNDLIKIIK
jgi:DNA-binding Xre family transcriptional regulator